MYIEQNQTLSELIKILKEYEFVPIHNLKERLKIIHLISKKLRNLSLKKKDPETLELCKFFNSCTKNFNNWNENKKSIWYPKGIIYHIPSSNISLMPIYTWLPSFILGNSNLIRISKNLNKDYLKEIIEIIDSLLGETESKRQIFFNDNEEFVNSYIASLNCKVRVLWGDNASINNIKTSQISNCSLDISFNNRYSSTLIDCSLFLEMNKEEQKRFYKSMVNDTLNLSFNACSSPHIIYFLGTKSHYRKVKSSLIENLGSSQNKDNIDFGIISTENIFKSQKSLIKNKSLYSSESVLFGRPIIEINPLQLKKVDLKILKNNTLFIETNTIDEILSNWRTEIQTLTYMSISKKEIINEINQKLKGKGPDRIITIGEALKFDTIWDGMNFFELFTKQSSFYE